MYSLQKAGTVAAFRRTGQTDFHACCPPALCLWEALPACHLTLPYVLTLPLLYALMPFFCCRMGMRHSPRAGGRWRAGTSRRACLPTDFPLTLTWLLGMPDSSPSSFEAACCLAAGMVTLGGQLHLPCPSLLAATYGILYGCKLPSITLAQLGRPGFQAQTCLSCFWAVSNHGMEQAPITFSSV